MKILILVVLCLVISACSNKSPNDVVAVKSGDDYYQVDEAAARSLEGKTDDHVMCTRRSVVGSNRKQKVCTTSAELNKDREDARDLIDQHKSMQSRKLARSKHID